MNPWIIGFYLIKLNSYLIILSLWITKQMCICGFKEYVGRHVTRRSQYGNNDISLKVSLEKHKVFTKYTNELFH